MSRKTLLARALAPVAVALLLASCGDDAGSSAAATSRNGMPPASALPGCDSIAAATNGFVNGWTLTEDSGPMRSEDDDNYGVSCTWLSPRAHSDNPFEVMQSASFGVMISVQSYTQTEAEVRSIGWVVDDPAVEDAGAFLVFPSGRLDFDKQLRAVGPQVVKDKVTVGLGQTGVMLVNEIDEGKPMTNRRAVDTALAVHRLIRW